MLSYRYYLKFFSGFVIISIINELLKTKIVLLNFWVPDLYIIYLVYNAMLIGNPLGTFEGLFIGFFQDIFSPAFFGFNIIFKGILGSIIGGLKFKIEITGNWYIGLIYFFVILFNDFLIFFIKYLTNFKLIFSLIYQRTLPVAVSSFFVGMALNYIFDKIFSSEVKEIIDGIEKN